MRQPKTGDGEMGYAIKTNKKTSDGLTVYDLDPQASELWAVAGPDGIDPSTIDTDDLPEGFRWVESEEWESLDDAAKPTKTITVTWEDGKLVARCDEDHTLDSSVVEWDEPITASTDSWAVAHAVTEINHAEILAVDHDGKYIHITVDGSVLQ
jgi:hypothetical protein